MVESEGGGEIDADGRSRGDGKATTRREGLVVLLMELLILFQLVTRRSAVLRGAFGASDARESEESLLQRRRQVLRLRLEPENPARGRRRLAVLRRRVAPGGLRRRRRAFLVRGGS